MVEIDPEDFGWDITPLDIAWVAGFLEGEGSFVRNHGYARIRVSQVEPECLHRLQRLFGGSVSIENGPVRQASTSRPLWSWNLWGARAELLMRNILPLMSPRRVEQITASLDAGHAKWENQPKPQKRGKGFYGPFKKEQMSDG